MKKALAKRYQLLNRANVAHDRVAIREHIKDLYSFNEEFLRILLYIQYMSEEEKTSLH